MDRARRSPLRFLAPIGLAAFALAFLLVVTSADDVSDDGESNRANDAAEQRDLEGADDRRERRRERRESGPNEDVYIVKEGDTLASIAESTGVSVEELQELNPELDPQALVTGQRVRLRE